MYENVAALKTDYASPRFLIGKTVLGRNLSKAVKNRVIMQKQEDSVALLAKEEWCCDWATD
jgi:hypothetical protein